MSRMEAILVALITGGLSLLGVVITNMMAARRAEQRMVTAQAVTDALGGADPRSPRSQ